jgi:hypothetical protein
MKNVSTLLCHTPLCLRTVFLWLTMVREHLILTQVEFYHPMRALEKTVTLQELHQDIFHPRFTHGLDFVDQPYRFLVDLEKTC